jgi:hypothetical protein
LEKKVNKLVVDLEEVRGIALMTPRKCSKVRGKLSNYSICMQRIRPFIVPFNAFIGGPRNNRDWDRSKRITDEMRDAGSFLLKHMGNSGTAQRADMAFASLHCVRSLHAEGAAGANTESN